MKERNSKTQKQLVNITRGSAATADASIIHVLIIFYIIHIQQISSTYLQSKYIKARSNLHKYMQLFTNTTSLLKSTNEQIKQKLATLQKSFLYTVEFRHEFLKNPKRKYASSFKRLTQSMFPNCKKLVLVPIEHGEKPNYMAEERGPHKESMFWLL
ncbi:hypothetical protein M9H77_11321 [Catharanthus roseus]|uniref:Uncharacterized protein n=1 Tax=Catharanthus roseus TaxID=4058 RepID=A0ACC0BE85_CATRO|nr:hypothetical protein M9H77_11321 [Catharanthus roseus]